MTWIETGDDRLKSSQHCDDAAKMEISELGEGLTISAPEKAAAVDDIEYTDTTNTETPKLSTEASEVIVSKMSAESIHTDAVTDGDANVSGGFVGSGDAEDAQSTVASNNAAGEAGITTDQDEQDDGVTSATKQLRTVDQQLDKLFPDIWKAAQFLAGRQVSQYSLVNSV